MGDLIGSTREKNYKNFNYSSYSVSNKLGFVNQNILFKNGGIAINANKKNSLIVKKGYFAYNPARIDIGSIGLYKNDKAGLVSPLYEVFNVLNKLNSDWLFLWFKSNIFKYIVEKYKEGSVRNTLYLKNIEAENLYIPSENEQTKIFVLINNLNNLITLHQRKLKAIENIKKTLLDKMFPDAKFKISSIKPKKFTHTWEQEKLENLYLYGKSGGTPLSSKKEFYNGNIPFLSITDITNSNHFIYKTSKFISREGLKNSAAWLVPKESISLAMYASIGKVAILKNDISTSQAIFNIVIENNAPLRDLLFWRLKKMEKNNEWQKFSSSGTQENLTSKIIQNHLIHVTRSELEQIKISKLLNTLNNLITLHQRKLKALENIKKTLLDKMFPDEKSNIPSIRFKEFTNAWEQEKLGNVASVINGKSNSNNAVKNGQYPFYIRSKEILRSNKFLFDEEAVITIGEGNIGKVFHFVKGKFDLHQRCYKIYNFNSYIFAKFFYYYFSQHFYKRAISDSSKATVDSIRLETITGMNIKFSQLINEQIKISKLLDSLNNLITLHQRKLKAIENIKKTLLDKMFPDAKFKISYIKPKKFTHTWEQEKLIEICYLKNNLRIPVREQERNKGKNPYYGANGIIDYVNTFTHEGSYILIAEDGANDLNNYPIHYASGKIFVNNHAHVISCDSKNNLKFIYYILKKFNFKKVIVGNIRYKLNASQIKSICISITENHEQNVISLTMDKIYNLITLHQRGLFWRENEEKIRNIVL